MSFSNSAQKSVGFYVKNDSWTFLLMRVLKLIFNSKCIKTAKYRESAPNQNLTSEKKTNPSLLDVVPLLAKYHFGQFPLLGEPKRCQLSPSSALQQATNRGSCFSKQFVVRLLESKFFETIYVRKGISINKFYFTSKRIEV